MDKNAPSDNSARRRPSLIEPQQDELRAKLVEHDFDKPLIDQVVEAGYFAWQVRQLTLNEVRPCVMDSYYGNKYAGLIEYGQFVRYLRTGEFNAVPCGVAEYSVKSISEVRTILGRPENARYASRMSFRGQTKDHWIKRSVPNPNAKRADGQERMIVPSWWRQWINKNPVEREAGPAQSIFSNTIFTAPLLYHDIPDWRRHYLDEGEGHRDGEVCKVCVEMEERRQAHNHNASFSNEIPLLEQHYGIPTIGLDITFDPAVAFFFASHSFVGNQKGRASFEPVAQGNQQGVVYCFVFEWPPVRETEYLIRDIGLFKNLSPIRPIRQYCGLPGFHMHEIGAAARDLHAIFYLDTTFDQAALPSFSYLFPTRDEDRFYRALLEQRQLHPDIWGEVVEYE